MLKLITNIFKPFTFRQPASFEFSGSTDEAVKLLSQNVKRPWFFTFEELLIGKVSDSSISVWHYRPFRRQMITAVFTGQFAEENNRTILTGEFAIHKWQKIISIILSILLLLFQSFIALVIHVQHLDKKGPLIGLFVLIFPWVLGLIVLHISYGVAKDDIKWIETKLKEILQSRAFNT